MASTAGSSLYFPFPFCVIPAAFRIKGGHGATEFNQPKKAVIRRRHPTRGTARMRHPATARITTTAQTPCSQYGKQQQWQTGPYLTGFALLFDLKWMDGHHRVVCFWIVLIPRHQHPYTCMLLLAALKSITTWNEPKSQLTERQTRTDSKWNKYLLFICMLCRLLSRWANTSTTR